MTDASASIVPTLHTIPVTERLYEHRKNRRMWLLLKALEDDLPLNKALALAAAAESFLSGDKT
jgi:hypothetical protein